MIDSSATRAAYDVSAKQWGHADHRGVDVACADRLGEAEGMVRD